jgi:hypothetical protein
VGAIGSGQVVIGAVTATPRSWSDDEEVARARANVVAAVVGPDATVTKGWERPVTEETVGVCRTIPTTASSPAGTGATNRWTAAAALVTTGRITSVTEVTGGTPMELAGAERTTACTPWCADAMTGLTAPVTGSTAVVTGFVAATTGGTVIGGAEGTADGIAGLPRGATGRTDDAIGRTGALGAGSCGPEPGAGSTAELGAEMDAGVAACACPLVSRTPAATAPNSNPAWSEPRRDGRGSARIDAESAMS